MFVYVQFRRWKGRLSAFRLEVCHGLKEWFHLFFSGVHRFFQATDALALETTSPASQILTTQKRQNESWMKKSETCKREKEETQNIRFAFSVFFCIDVQFLQCLAFQALQILQFQCKIRLRLSKTYSSSVFCVIAIFSIAHCKIRRPGRCLCHCKTRSVHFCNAPNLCMKQCNVYTGIAIFTLLE